jgi:flavin-dependent dehydrogenase
MTLRPIEIAGGGLAGLSLGIALRRAGVPVVLHDAGTYPRHRVCGEFVAGLSPLTIDRLGLGAALRDAREHRDVAWFLGNRVPGLQRLPHPALGLSRHALDARLAGAFAGLGGDLRTNSRVAAGDRPGLVWAVGRRRARVPRWIGLKVHTCGIELVRDLEMHLGDQGYVGLCRVEDDTVNVCGLFRQRNEVNGTPGTGILAAYLRASGLTALARRVETSPVVPGTACAVAALDFEGTGEPAPGLGIGDAGATTPPFTGNGMAMALQSAESALEPLLAYAHGRLAWPDATAAVRGALRRRFRRRLAWARALHPFLLQAKHHGWIAILHRARMLPFGPLYGALH